MYRAGFASLLLSLFIAATPAAAHKLKAFATVDGDAISGTVFFSGNVPAREVSIQVLDPDGHVVGRTASDENGRFRIAIAGPFDHRIVADTGDGHHSEFVVRREELPSDAQAHAPPAMSAAAAAALPPTFAAPAARPPSSDIDTVVEQTVSRQLAPLREQLDAFEERVLWRDVLGGIGYIIGLFGLAAWLISRHRKEHGGRLKD